MHSDIFDNYIKIALEKGLISEADAKENPRIGSDGISDIEILYGKIKEKNIVDEAHPTPVIIAPSYDKLNGLVENVNERQKIMINILNKIPTGKSTHHRYARDELLSELFKVGFSMDHRNESELTALADHCAENLTKQAFLPLVGVIAGGLSLIGAYNNFAYLSQGVSNDCDFATEALDKFASQVPDSSYQLNELKKGIEYVKSLYEKTIKKASDLKSIKSNDIIQDAMKAGSSPEGKEAFKLMEQYKRAASILADRIVRIYVPLIETTDPSQDKNSSSLWTGLTDAWHGLFGSAKQDVLKVLVGSNVSALGEGGLVGSLRKSVEQIVAKENAMKVYVEQNKDDLLKYLQEEASPAENEPSKEPTKTPQSTLMQDLQGNE